ncbi:fungal-specific transcription factor domain-containing protein [Dipodascopsis tothii]|uniref:fungal-specific transcription factor domain-containing protein n=1 Tax=Dipodascopsis tothii TaxID=44089 RepID=UPI0034CE3627
MSNPIKTGGADGDIFVYENNIGQKSEAAGAPTGPKRTPRACVRCRKQKLKCDPYRPCALCERAHVECVSRPEPATEQKRDERPPKRPLAAMLHSQSSSTSREESSESSFKLSPSVAPKPPVSPPTGTPSRPAASSSGRSLSPSPIAPAAPSPLAASASLGMSMTLPLPLPNPFHHPSPGAMPSPFTHAASLSAGLAGPALPAISSQTFDGVPSLPQIKNRHFAGRTSALGITQEILSSYNSDELLSRSQTSAFPGSDPSRAAGPAVGTHAAPAAAGGVMPWTHTRPPTVALLKTLPPKPVMDYTIDVFFNTVHWFIMVIHEGTFLSQYQQIMSAFLRDPESIPDSEENFSLVLMIMMVIVSGGRYAAVHPARLKRINQVYSDYVAAYPASGYRSTFDIHDSMSRLLSTVRAYLLDQLACGTLSTVQTCILLGTFYLYHGDPNISWAVLGSAVKAAQSLGLHKEPAAAKEGRIDEKREIRRRVFWALYNYDRFSAMSYGRPMGFNDEDCDVGFPSDDSPYPAAGCSSYLMVEDDLEDAREAGRRPITLITYQTYKLQFYILLTEILTTLYRQGNNRGFASFFDRFSNKPKPKSAQSTNRIETLINNIQNLDYKIRRWYESVPTELKLKETDTDGFYMSDDLLERELGSHQHEEDDEVIQPPHDDANRHDPNVRARRQRIRKANLEMQALFLQLAYDNAIILINRPLLAYRNQAHGLSNTANASDPFSLSVDRCWEAALRTSKISRLAIFRNSQYTHAVSFMGIHLFTAGVLLSVFGSSEPLSQRALESKRALSRIIQMEKMLRQKVAVAEQGFQILEKLAMVVVQKEVDKILHGGSYMDDQHRAQSLDTSHQLHHEGHKDKPDDDTTAAQALTRLSYSSAAKPGAPAFRPDDGLLDASSGMQRMWNPAMAQDIKVPPEMMQLNDQAMHAGLADDDFDLLHNFEVVKNPSFNETLLNLERVMLDGSQQYDDPTGTAGFYGLHEPQQAWIWSSTSPYPI